MMIRNEWGIRVKIREELKRELVFGLKSRLPIAIILGFVGFRDEVLPMMQYLSHGTRAYIWNEDGLKGFVQRIDILVIEQKYAKTKEYQETTKWQVVNLDSLASELITIETLFNRCSFLAFTFHASMFLY